MPDSKNELVNEAIDASIKFEELMDITDFDSWLDDDNAVLLEDLGQDPAPFIIYEENKKKLKGIYESINSGVKKSNNSGDKSSLEEIIFNLFQSKYIRMEARICSNKKEEEVKYREALYHLLSGLYTYQNPKAGNIDERLLVLLYNDLSICYAGLENSSLSRGYAEEARNIIEGEQREFRKDPKLYHLYTIAIFNQAVAERRSYLYTEAERNFKKIIDDVYNGPSMSNFNYYSALLYLSDLYIDLGRGEEAIELLNIVEELDEDDIRYWNSCLIKTNCFIDQSKYGDSENLLLNKFIIKENNGGINEYILNKRHKVTAQGFKALNYLFRSMIEKERNKLKKVNNNDELRKVYKNIDNNIIKDIEDRQQEGLARKAYRQLSDIAIILEENEELLNNDDVIRNIIKYLSYPDSDIKDLEKFVSDKGKMNKWIDDCDDLDILERFVYQILVSKIENKYLSAGKIKLKYRDLLERLKEKIKSECDEKGQLSRSEKVVKKIDIALEKSKGVPFNESSFIKGIENTLPERDIVKRLDINEKQFDMILYERKNNFSDNIVEMILLRRWNSFSPGLFREASGSLGGGYLIRIKKENVNTSNIHECNINENDRITDDIRRKDKIEYDSVMNIVIDPGYNFLRNFIKEGFLIDDIDIIIVTHSHLDHCAELPQIMDLIYQLNKRYKNTPGKARERKKVKLCLSQGAYRNLSSYIPVWKMQLKDVIILENLVKEKCEPFKGLSISSKKTHHSDLGGVNAIGLKIDIGIENEKNICIGITGDTPWYDKLKDDFNDCDVLCVHLGSIKYQEIGYKDERYNNDWDKRIIKKTNRKDEFKKIYEETNHLLYYGTELLIEDCVKKKGEQLIVVSEFGEELKYGLRTDICTRLSKKTERKCIPADIGLYIGINKKRTIRVRCNFCDEYVSPKEIETFSYGLEDALHYICKTCNNTLSETQKDDVIEHRITRH